jgi:hypothetical protein
VVVDVAVPPQSGILRIGQDEQHKPASQQSEGEDAHREHRIPHAQFGRSTNLDIRKHEEVLILGSTVVSLKDWARPVQLDRGRFVLLSSVGAPGQIVKKGRVSQS